MKTLIAVCGRTNVGKTAFITTLRHKYSGKIRDESSTTTDITDYPHETLSIILSDFPGFEKIAAVESYLNIEKENPGLAINIRDLILKDEISKRDYELIQELKNKDLVFVVCSIENVPEASHMAEINLIKSANPNIIAIISKTGIYEKNDRINTWITFLERMGIKSHIEFDAHFDSKYKIIDLMVFVSNILPEGDKVENLKLSMGIFKNTLEKQHKRIREGFVKVISSIASLELRATLKSELNIQLSNFKLQVSKAFELYIESITSSLGITIDEFNNITNSIKACMVLVRSPGTSASITATALTTWCR